MGRNRKIQEQFKSANATLLRRAERINKKHLKTTRTRSTTTILDLPNEILLHIFSMLPRKVLLCKIRAVCKRWNELTKYATFWNKLDLNCNIPIKVISKWISMAPQLKHLVVRNRTDLDQIFKEVSKNCKQLENLEVYNCRGTPKSLVVHSLPMCNLISRCWNLRNIRFRQITFESCKFFKLLPTTRSHKIAKASRPCSYVGPISRKQLNAFLESIKQVELEKSVVIGNKRKMYTLKQLTDMIDKSKQETDQTNIVDAIMNSI